MRGARGQFAIRFPNALVKLLRLLLHPISSARFLHSRLRSSRIDIENKSNVWDAIADCKYIQTFDRLTIQFSCRALINGCGIKETIGNHANATFKRWLDNLPHELAATRLKEKQLRFRGHTRIVRSKLQKFTNGFADRRAAGFAGDQMWHPGTLQSRGQSLHLRRFSTAL